MIPRLLIIATCLGFAFGATAKTPKVTTDIAPIHSLVAQVMNGLGEPILLTPQNSSPHTFSMRPSVAQALQEADIVFWMSPDLTPWLDKGISSLSDPSKSMQLMEAEGAIVFDMRVFGEEKHEDEHQDDEHEGEDHADEHHDDENADEKHEDEEHSDEEHADEHAHEDHHAHTVDPHGWLDPVNAQAWLRVIAKALSVHDPENADLYSANAEKAIQEIDTLTAELEAILSPVKAKPFIAYHDAYQYFDIRFGLNLVGVVALQEDVPPSAGQMIKVRDLALETPVECILTEPQFDSRSISVILESTNAKTAEIDPIGFDLELGVGLYSEVLRKMANSISSCLS